MYFLLRVISQNISNRITVTVQLHCLHVYIHSWVVVLYHKYRYCDGWAPSSELERCVEWCHRGTCTARPSAPYQVSVHARVPRSLSLAPSALHITPTTTTAAAPTTHIISTEYGRFADGRYECRQCFAHCINLSLLLMAAHTAASFIVQQYSPGGASMCLHLVHGSLSTCQSSAPQTASQSVRPVPHDSAMWSTDTDRQTDRQAGRQAGRQTDRPSHIKSILPAA